METTQAKLAAIITNLEALGDDTGNTPHLTRQMIALAKCMVELGEDLRFLRQRIEKKR